MKALSSPWQVSAGEGLGRSGDADHVFRVVTACLGQHLFPAIQPATSSPHRPALREFINQVLGGLCIFILPPLLSLLFYQGTLGEKVMINFNKNKIKMIKPFISVRDNLSSAG